MLALDKLTVKLYSLVLLLPSLTKAVAALMLTSNGLTVMVKVFSTEVSTPPLAIPPLSLTFTPIVAVVAVVVAAEVKVRLPALSIAGATLNNSGLLLLLIVYSATVWADSFSGPLENVAQVLKVCAVVPTTMRFVPGVTVGASLTGATLMLMSLPGSGVAPCSVVTIVIFVVPLKSANGVNFKPSKAALISSREPLRVNFPVPSPVGVMLLLLFAVRVPLAAVIATCSVSVVPSTSLIEIKLLLAVEKVSEPSSFNG